MGRASCTGLAHEAPTYPHRPVGSPTVDLPMLIVPHSLQWPSFCRPRFPPRLASTRTRRRSRVVAHGQTPRARWPHARHRRPTHDRPAVGEAGRPASATLAPDMTRAIGNYLTAPSPRFGFNNLKPSADGNSLTGPSGVAVSSYYVAFLRKNAPRIRLRMRSATDPLLIVLDGRPVGLLMPGG